MNDPSGLRISFKYFLRYMHPYRGQFVLLALLLSGSIGLQLLNPQVIRYFLDRAREGSGQKVLLSAAALYIGFAVVQRILALCAGLLSSSLGWGATNDLRKDLLRHCLRLDMSFHKQHTPGELIERVDGDVSTLANYFSRFVLQVAGSALLVIGILILLLREDLRLGIALSLYSLLVGLILSRLHHRAVARWADLREAEAWQNGFIEERISGAEEIRALGAGPYTLRRLQELAHIYLQRIRAAFLLDSLMVNLTRLLFAGGHAFGLALGIALYTRGEATLGAAYLIVYYTGMISEPLIDLQKQLQDFQLSSASLGRIHALFSLQPEAKDPANEREDPLPAALTGRQQSAAASQPPYAPPAVEFRRVSFRYETENSRPPVLENVSFSLEPGKVLGVLGRTGSGKTTLTRLLFRLYDPSAGAVMLNGLDLRSLPLVDLRSRIGLVTQDVQIFGATLRENLTLFNPTLSDDDLLRALHEVRLDSWLARLPDGLDTRLQAGGYGLSVGEAQLVAFTRVFLKKPGLVILDEASSHLDPVTESLMEAAVDRLLRERTAIIIAHRLHTVQRADEILILENGRVLEYGPRLELAADPQSRFHHLLQTGLEEWLQPGEQAAVEEIPYV